MAEELKLDEDELSVIAKILAWIKAKWSGSDGSKPAWLSKVNWDVIFSIALVALAYFGIDTEWLTSIAAGIGVEAVTLGIIATTVINGILKVLTWLFYKYVKKS